MLYTQRGFSALLLCHILYLTILISGKLFFLFRAHVRILVMSVSDARFEARSILSEPPLLDCCQVSPEQNLYFEHSA